MMLILLSLEVEVSLVELMDFAMKLISCIDFVCLQQCSVLCRKTATIATIGQKCL